MTASKKAITRICLAAGIVVLLAVFFTMSASGEKTERNTGVQTQGRVQKNYLIAGGEHFSIDITKTPAERERGLSGRTGLAAHEAMLFIFDTEDRYGFWMKDMLFPIDIVWLNAEYKVVYIKSKASQTSYPEVFFPEIKAKYVVEFPSGTAERINLEKGSFISLVSED